MSVDKSYIDETLDDIMHRQPAMNQHNRGFHPWEKDAAFQLELRQHYEKEAIKTKSVLVLFV